MDPHIKRAQEYAKNILTKPEYEHAIRVANIIQEKKLENETIIASILHDTLYLNKTTYEEITKLFGENIANILKEISLTETVLIKNYSKIPNETLSSLILSISSDLQTILIQTAETIDVLKNEMGDKEEIKKIAKIADEIYTPLAIKLGLGDFSWKLQDYSFKVLNNPGYNKIKKLLNKTIDERQQKINKMKSELEKLFETRQNITITGRPKNFKSIYLKMKKVPFKKMYDLYGIRIICNKERECYEILGMIHSKYDFIKEAFDDYIAKEKKSTNNGYQSIHTAIIKNSDLFEIQIRTWQMHLKIESSMYWQYKNLKKDKNFETELSWERQLIEWQKSIGEQTNKRKIVKKNIFVFTPKQDVITLKPGATALDFAFAIHTEIGQHAQKAIINNKIVSLETPLQNLDTAQIITHKNPTIKKNWLTIVRMEKSKQKIRSYFDLEPINKKSTTISQKNVKKIKIAECCNPLPGEDVIGIKTTKRKIIIHKKDCPNIKIIPKEKLIEIGFENSTGKTKIKIQAIDRIGLLGEILNEMKKNNIKLINSDFQIKKSSFVEATFELSVPNINKLDKLINNLEKLSSIQSIERQ